MARLDLTNNISGTLPDDMPVAILQIVNALEDQYNANPQIFPIAEGSPLPQGMIAGDIVVGVNSNDNPTFGLYNGQNVQTISQDTVTQGIQFNGQNLSGSGAPTTSQFPNDGDWGFYTDTTGPTTYIARNTGGTIQTSTLV